MESVRNKLGPLIKQKRKLLGMTQEDLAERLNISISFAGQIERGEAMPSVEMLQLIIISCYKTVLSVCVGGRFFTVIKGIKYSASGWL